MQSGEDAVDAQADAHGKGRKAWSDTSDMVRPEINSTGHRQPAHADNLIHPSDTQEVHA